MPSLVTVNDWNDGTALASEAEAMEYASFKSTRLNRVTKRYFKPTIALETNTDTTTDANAVTMKNRWLSTAFTDVRHMGLKEGYVTSANTGADTLGYMKIYTTYYIACRSPR